MDSGLIVPEYQMVINLTEFVISSVRIGDLSQLNRCDLLE
jgi:hypothetical protein